MYVQWILPGLRKARGSVALGTKVVNLWVVYGGPRSKPVKKVLDEEDLGASVVASGRGRSERRMVVGYFER